MRAIGLLFLALVNCSGGVGAGSGGEASGTLEADAGAPVVAGSAGVTQRQEAAPGAAGGSSAAAGGGLGMAGTSSVATAGTSDSGGTSSAAAGDAGAGGQGGSVTTAPDDTGCVERPWSGDAGDLGAQVAGLDCSNCSTGETLGYAAPSFCTAAASCEGAVELATLPDDSLLLLPPGSAQKGFCAPQACSVPGSQPVNLEGFTLQLMINVPSGHTILIETDADRRVVKRDVPLFACSEASSCAAWGSAGQLAIVVKPEAGRGWARIRVDTGETCAK